MISTVDRLRLAALLGMLGSNHVGERENAARLVEQFRRQRGLNWCDLLGRPPENASGPDRPSPPPSSSPEPAPAPAAPGYRIQDLVWRWLMLLGLAAVGLMSLTSMAQQHAAEKRITARMDGPCLAGACPEGDAGIGGAGRHPAATALPAPFAEGLADRRMFEAWRAAAPAGLCSGRPADRKEWASACAIARKLLAQFEQRRRTDPVFLAGWNSLTQ